MAENNAWFMAYVLEFDILCQMPCNYEQIKMSKAFLYGSIKEEDISLEPFLNIPKRPRNLSEWTDEDKNGRR